jgi:hypothetical protein
VQVTYISSGLWQFFPPKQRAHRSRKYLLGLSKLGLMLDLAESGVAGASKNSASQSSMSLEMSYTHLDLKAHFGGEIAPHPHNP